LLLLFFSGVVALTMMYRSASATRFSDELPTAPKVVPGLRGSEADELPVFSPFSEVAKKQRKLPPETAVHLIPVVLILCGFILWLKSYPIMGNI